MISELKKALMSISIFFMMLSPVFLFTYLQFPRHIIVDFIGIVVIGFIFYLAGDKN